MCACSLRWWPSPCAKSISCSPRPSSAAGEWGPCQRQEPGREDEGCRFTPVVKASVMFTKVFWEDFAWEHLMVGSDTQATWSRGTCRSSCQVRLGTGVSAQSLLHCGAGEKQSSTAECLWRGSKPRRGWSCPGELPVVCGASGQGTPFPPAAAVVRSQPDPAQQDGEGVTPCSNTQPSLPCC